MTISLKGLLAAAIAGLLANSAMAADGTINFTGEITSASCTITGGSGTTVGGGKGNYTIDIDLKKVPIDALGGSAGGGIAAGTNINLSLDCGNTGTGLDVVQVKFDPAGGSGIDPYNPALLKTTGTATGVGIGIYDTSNNLLDLSANQTFDATLDKDESDPNNIQYSAELNLRAGYVKSGSAMPTAGTADGTLPFTLTYN